MLAGAGNPLRDLLLNDRMNTALLHGSALKASCLPETSALHRSIRVCACLCASITCLSACGGPEKDAVTIQFALSPRSDSAATDDALQIHDLRFYIHDVALLASDRVVPLTLATDDWQNGRVALIDMVGSTTADQNMAVRGTLPDARTAYSGLRFMVGVPFEMNHADPLAAAAPLNRGEMFWTWQSGYKFLRADLSDASREWSFHLGSTGCSSGSAIRPPLSPCLQPNIVAVELTGFDPTRQAILLRFDELVAAMRASNHVACTGAYADNTACAMSYAITGMDARAGRCAADTCREQRLFTGP